MGTERVDFEGSTHATAVATVAAVVGAGASAAIATAIGLFVAVAGAGLFALLSRCGEGGDYMLLLDS